MSSLKKIILPLVIFCCTFIVYAHNLSQASYGGDVGDLLTASAVMGVAHPPGYPLFTILGFLLSRIHFISPAFMIGLISALSGALVLFFYYFFAYKFTKSKLISLISVLVLAFSYYFWFYNEIAEAFALNNLFAIILLLLAFFYFQSKKIKYLFWLSFFAGLSLTNHQTIILIFPSLFLLSFQNLRKDFRNLKTFLACVVFFIIGLLPYVYIPIASSHNPPVNWDNVHDLSSFLRLVLRQDYGTLTIGSIGVASFAQKLVTLRQYLVEIVVQATLPTMVVVLIGMWYCLKKYKQVFWALFLAFLLSGPVFIFYAGFSFLNSFTFGIYERFIILSFMVILMFFPFGLLFIRNSLQKFFSRKEFALIILCAFFIIPLSLFRLNYPKTDLSNLTLGEDIVYDLLSPLPKNSVIFLDGDTIVFNTWYVQYVKHFRPDIIVINASGLAVDNKLYKDAANKYFKQHPGEKKDQGVNINVIAEMAKTRNVFTVSGAQSSKSNAFDWIPYGLSYKFVFKQNYPSVKEYIAQIDSIWKNIQTPFKKKSLAEGNFTVSDIYSYYAEGLLRTGEYFADTYKDSNEALKYYKKAIEVDPQNDNSYQTVGSYYITNKNCVLAEENFRKAISISPYKNLPYFLLYYDYQDCFKSSEKEKQLISEYKNNFRTDFFQDLKNTIQANKGK